jgi:SAM-dependent MidA family methyltransferase
MKRIATADELVKAFPPEKFTINQLNFFRAVISASEAQRLSLDPRDGTFEEYTRAYSITSRKK